MNSRISTTLLRWYRYNKRSLPWRDRQPVDPYAVWVSEIMLQQTRVEAVIPYFEHWMELFPTVRALADASEQDVLNAWEGLGYYSRARNLHKAAGIVVERYGGELPRGLEELARLPGIGRYTLGAIASIAYGMPVAALDGNIKRVYARLFDIFEPVDTPRGEKMLWELADGYLPNRDAGDYNQALMDLGATICIPKNPRCLICPVMKLCKARRHGTQDARPLKSPKKSVPHHIHAAGVILNQTNDCVILARRPPEGLLGGMWEFPNGRVEGEPLSGLDQALKTGYGLRLRKMRQGARAVEPFAIVQHGYTHFTVTVYAYRREVAALTEAENLKWVPLEALDDYPMGRIDRQIATLLSKKNYS
ncbi:MAG: A/G-specific adenine glycosylase [Bacteroidota bacterium]